MKLPNGYGSITKLTGNRRKPWMARVTCDETYDETKHDYVRKRIVLGYYPTKKLHSKHCLYTTKAHSNRKM